MSWSSGGIHQQQLRMPQQPMVQQQQPQLGAAPNLLSQFHLFPLIEAIADATERGVRDQRVDDLVNELGNRFERCQQLLAPHAASSKPLTLRNQKMKLQEYENQLNLRREALSKYREMVE
ncbi:hypothetical protein SELMODRAFT_405193 [Selaginella moellendorffii]|uniref:Mediator complex subunit 9 n=1 Tax=Selaginella moellendorffii TaxID=88036 RepID=D8QWJ1_SELML|nr:mediator of RNA polymerase II transcription subunit 9 [Selaginella moellendorffii]EFJ35645.1 hypothetical protein SELMODRAFT_405193 [Selaginella moellendorffii]|eukprot:XP_002963774.1 mediator of RNA polymerase II transcription subunit 9 [Selaginella moellendorffii]